MSSFLRSSNGSSPTRRVYVPASGLGPWQQMLADPERQWVRVASAYETAVFWEGGARTERGLPGRLAALLDTAPSWQSSEVLAAFPEHRVGLPGGSRASQNDVWVMLRGATGLLSLAVEGKATETFGTTVSEWTKEPTPGRVQRLDYLCGLLGLDEPVDGQLRYQLLHRAGSALIEAERIGAVSAGMVVLSFKNNPASQKDFARFGAAIGASCAPGTVLWAQTVTSVPFFVAWLDLPPATDAEIAAVTTR